MAAFSKANSSGSVDTGTSARADTAGGGGTPGSGESGSGAVSALAEAMGDSGGSSNPSADSSSTSGSSDSSASETSGASSTSAQNSDTAGGGSETSSDEASGEVKSGGTLAAAGSLAAKVGKVAVGTTMNLAQGSWDVAKQSVTDRVASTTGGKIAAAINAREKAEEKEIESPKFGNDSLSAGSKTVDAASEIAAFRDRGSNAG